MAIEYYVVTPKGKRISTHETVESARRAIERTSNVVIFSPDALKALEVRRKAGKRGPWRTLI